MSTITSFDLTPTGTDTVIMPDLPHSDPTTEEGGPAHTPGVGIIVNGARDTSRRDVQVPRDPSTTAISRQAV